MSALLQHVPPRKQITGADYNKLVDMVNSMRIENVQGMKMIQTERGTHLIGYSGQTSPRAYIAEVDSNATGGGYYNCHLQTLDATDWNSTTADQLDDTGNSVVVLNLPEIPETGDTSSHQLSAGDKIICWVITDDEGAKRYVGHDALRLTEC